MARRILTRYGGVRGVWDASPADLSLMTGLDEFEVFRAQALMEIGRRAAVMGPGDKLTIQSPEDAVQLIVKRLHDFRHERREHVFAILLDSKNQILKIEIVHIGTLNMSVIGPREIYRIAIREGASSLILAHNHPSGDPTPSPEDIDITRKLVDIGLLLDIPLIDHLVLGDPHFVSLHQRGVL
jgi:DNA repair protein RadC